ncbi:PadR family transcriptional regulator [Priestia megaterium]|uniref:PadR family transcriptional regulator n=1 Tax=Priestia megaterium TaxID=1404 RepID=UPI001EDA472E|nr:PadR family transcriptional regulator [Priestia megaterium]MDH3161185.1 PadR family transcriptional regulator [Priestia megaterium]MED4117220.1 PadR family transcriptional regulator [Priestia megaterium]UKJ83526.1 PadR family transcriptional regulator [Priestia megaterium]
MYSQMIKGLLEGSILSLINKKEVYGYELIERLRTGGFNKVSEGTIYPLLIRLQKEDLISAYFMDSKTGPRRKYYKITPKGLKSLKNFKDEWRNLEQSVNNFLEFEGVRTYQYDLYRNRKLKD